MHLGLAQKNIVVNLLVLLTTAATITFVSYYAGTKTLVEHTLQNLSSQITQEEIYILNHVNSLERDTRYLSSPPAVRGIYRAIEGGGTDTAGNSNLEQWKNQLTIIFSTILGAKPEYLQARLLDIRGQEILRIEKLDGNIRRIADAQLQDKSDNLYVQSTLKLFPGQVFLSRISLNREHGQVTVPHIPVLRAATPIYSSKNKLLGLIVINMDFSRLLLHLSELFKEEQGNIFITNDEGSFLAHPDPKKRFSFDLDHEHRIQETYSQLKDLFLPDNMENGRTIIPKSGHGDVLVGAKLHFYKLDQQRFVFFALTRPYEQVVAGGRSALTDTGLIILVLLLFFSLVSYLVSRLSSQPLQQVTDAISSFTLEEVGPKLPVNRKDEIGLLARAFDNLSDKVNLSQLALKTLNKNLESTIADRTHDLAQTVKLLNTISISLEEFIAHPELRVAFNTMLANLLEITKSEYGFIGEISSTDHGRQYLRIYAISSIDWNSETREIHEQRPPQEIALSRLKAWFGAALETGQPVFTNEPGNETSETFFLEGLPSPDTFLVIPIFLRNTLVGIAGIANRKAGYTQQIVKKIEPIATTCANLIHAYQVNEHALLTQDRLHKSEAQQRAVFENIVDGIITIDSQGNIAGFNPAAEDIFAYKAEEVMGKNIDTLMPEPYQSAHSGYLRNYIESGERKIIGFTREVFGQRKDGTTFPMDLAVNELHLGDERMFTGIIRDITERKRIDRMKNEFISTVSHELRTPLTSIRGSLGLICGGTLGEFPEPVNDMLTIATNNTERLLLLINDILDIQKIESGKLVFRFHNLDTKAFLQQAIKENQAFAHQYGVRFVVKENTDTPGIFADQDRLMQVMNNLMSNAAKFSPKGDTVELSVAHRSNVIRFSISDHGPGIPEEFRSKMFDKFTQSDSSDTRQIGGTGLGLNIARLIVEKHGGHIGFISQRGLGTTFYFELPSVAAGQKEPKTPPALVGDYAPHILIVEDDPDVALLIQRMLVETGFNSDVAFNAKEARFLLTTKGKKYKAMTLDISLPDENGIDMLSSLKEELINHHLPVVVISAKTDECKRVLEGAALGILDWLNKPIDPERLKNVLKSLATPDRLPRVLHVEDEEDVHKVVSLILQNKCELVWTTTVEASKNALMSGDFDLVLLDIELPDGSGLDLLDTIEERVTPLRVVIFSAHDVDKSVAARVHSVLGKSHGSNEQLLETITRAIRDP